MSTSDYFSVYFSALNWCPSGQPSPHSDPQRAEGNTWGGLLCLLRCKIATAVVIPGTDCHRHLISKTESVQQTATHFPTET